MDFDIIPVDFYYRDTKHIIDEIKKIIEINYESYYEFCQVLQERNITEEEFFDAKLFSYCKQYHKDDYRYMLLRYTFKHRIWPELGIKMEEILNERRSYLH